MSQLYHANTGPCVGNTTFKTTSELCVGIPRLHVHSKFVVHNKLLCNSGIFAVNIGMYRVTGKSWRLNHP